MSQQCFALLQRPDVRRQGLPPDGGPARSDHGRDGAHACEFLRFISTTLAQEVGYIATVIFVFPRMIIPASISFCTMAAFLPAFPSAVAHEPAVVIMPSSDAVMKASFLRFGMHR